MAKPLVGIIQDVQVPQDFIQFESWDPPTKSRTVVYEDAQVRGRSEPHVFYSHTETQIWSFSMHFLASFDQGDGGSPIGVQEKASFIESLVMPDYGQTPGQVSVIRPPHLARIRILRMIDLIGTIRSPQWVYGGSQSAVYDVVTGQPYQIDVTFQFHVQREFGKTPFGFADIRRLTARGQNRFSGG